ncbi:MAG TPA: aminotransferase class V-fold PLP-dependent enzyme [Burkholderiales bacterium]|nr:aminotransferase class V-fold PLP-dependent enzyme [Burkholderiales bacterium]
MNTPAGRPEAGGAATASAPIYLDYNATTPLLAEVLEAMLSHLRREFGNPSSDHPFGNAAREAVTAARAAVVELVGAKPAEIVFTARTTEQEIEMTAELVAAAWRRNSH